MSTELEFTIAETIEVKWDGAWYIANIIDINEKSVCVDDGFEWIDKTSNRLAKLHTHTIYENYLKLPPPNLIGKLVYSPTPEPYIIMCKDKYIDLYDISNDEWTIKYAQYPGNFQLTQNDAISFDAVDKCLHMIHIDIVTAWPERLVNYAKFYITTKQWT
eukprot:710680_1